MCVISQEGTMPLWEVGIWGTAGHSSCLCCAVCRQQSRCDSRFTLPIQTTLQVQQVVDVCANQ
jgi:hypothetical protein